MEASTQWGAFQISGFLMPPNFMSKACGVFSRRVLPLRSQRQPRAMTKAYIVLRVTPLTNNSKGGAPRPALGFVT